MLYSGIIANDRAERLIKHLADEEKFNTPSGPPSTPLDSPYYDPNCYWQGSNWPMTTYCVVEGLENYGEFDGASELRQRNLKLPNSEYAHPETGRALGISPFAPRAGLHLEFAAKEYDELAA